MLWFSVPAESGLCSLQAVISIEHCLCVVGKHVFLSCWGPNIPQEQEYLTVVVFFFWHKKKKLKGFLFTKVCVCACVCAWLASGLRHGSIIVIQGVVGKDCSSFSVISEYQGCFSRSCPFSGFVLVWIQKQNNSTHCVVTPTSSTACLQAA